MSSPSHRIAVIMAGGSGERFWPLSRRLRPKQLLHLSRQDETLLQEAVSRIAPLVGIENVFVATSSALADAIRSGDPRLKPENVLAEPAKRDTTGCLIWVAASLRARFGAESDVTLAILTADHLIGEPQAFRDTVDLALSSAEQQDALVTIGIPPTRAETGYGYIELAEGTAAGRGPNRVAVFREKPSADLAKEYLASGRHFWNSGMFFWRLTHFLAELGHAQGPMAAVVEHIALSLEKGDEAAAVREFETLPSLSIDYALMEHARNVLVVPAAFPWDDIGAWDALGRSFPHDAQGNVAFGDPVLVDCRNAIVMNEPGAENRAVAVVGLEDVVVVVSEDSVLVASKDRVQDVKKVVKELQRRGAKQL